MGKSRGKLGEPHENPLGTHWEHTRKQKQKKGSKGNRSKSNN
jgi:hypothetical protein